MKLRLIGLALAAGVVLAFGLLAGACKNGDKDGTPAGTDGTPTSTDGTPAGTDGTPAGNDGTPAGNGALEVYYSELDTLENEFRVASDQADADLAALDPTASPDEAAAVFEDVVAAIDAFVAGLEGLDPPEEAAEAHAEAAAGFRLVSAALSDVIDNVGDYATVEEFFAVFDDPEFVSADESLDGACRALQSIAGGNGIVVDLGCPE